MGPRNADTNPFKLLLISPPIRQSIVHRCRFFPPNPTKSPRQRFKSSNRLNYSLYVVRGLINCCRRHAHLCGRQTKKISAAFSARGCLPCESRGSNRDSADPSGYDTKAGRSGDRTVIVYRSSISGRPFTRD
jgi:hypothetical protein